MCRRCIILIVNVSFFTVHFLKEKTVHYNGGLFLCNMISFSFLSMM